MKLKMNDAIDIEKEGGIIKQIEIYPCKCGDYPRLRTNGGSYTHLICLNCGYESGPLFHCYLTDAIQRWNESDRDRERQRAGSAAFDSMMEYCQSVTGTPAEEEPIPKTFFQRIFGKK
jgi:hypothetical protein